MLLLLWTLAQMPHQQQQLLLLLLLTALALERHACPLPAW
jgi:hypothetical protein